LEEFIHPFHFNRLIFIYCFFELVHISFLREWEAQYNTGGDPPHPLGCSDEEKRPSK